MGKMLRNMLVGAVTFALVGVAIGLIFPQMAGFFGALGLSKFLVATVANGTYAPVILEAASFGLFGFILPPVQKLISHFFGDDAAKAAAAQQQENRLLEAKCAEIEGREHLLEQVVGNPDGRAHSYRSVTQGSQGPIETIVGMGPRRPAVREERPRNADGFAAAEEARAADAALQSRTIH